MARIERIRNDWRVDKPAAASSEEVSDLSSIELRSDAVAIKDGWQIELQHHLTTAHRPGFSRIDMRELFLPKASFTASHLTFKDRPSLARAVVLAIDLFLLNSRASKSRHLTASNYLHLMAKTVEYGWLNGAYELSDWTPALFEKLARILATEGWCAALEIERRAKSHISTLDVRERAALWHLQVQPQTTACSLKKGLFVLLGTNIGGRERTFLRNVVAREVAETNPEIASKVLGQGKKLKVERGASILQSELLAINMLMEAAGASYIPFPKPGAMVSALTSVKTKRTRSLGIDEVSRSLERASSYMYETGESLIALCAHLRDWQVKKKVQEKSHSITAGDVLRAASPRRNLEDRIGRKINWLSCTRTGDALSLNEVIVAFQSAAFLVIAFMNARRKDEILHPVVGIHSHALQRIDEELGIFQCEFYIEKTVRGYVPFYVNKITGDAISYLLRLSQIARDVHDANGGEVLPSSHRGETIFSLPQFDGVRGRYGMRWLTFDLSNRMRSHRYAREVLSVTGSTTRLSAHMLRRAYALIFHYRYENSSLIALRQQLQHFDLATTQIYVTDTVAVADSGIAQYGPLTPVQRAAVRDERRILATDLDMVAKERLHEFIEEILNGRRPHAGGYPRLVRRFHHALLQSLSYKEMDSSDQRKTLSSTLLKKGHLSRPMPHGNCMSGTAQSSLKGRCHSESSDTLDRAKASPVMCHACPYFVSLEVHVNNLESHRSALANRISSMEPDSLLRRSMSIELRSLEHVIVHQRARLDRGPSR